MEAMGASISTDSGKFHVFPWKLPRTSMEANLLPPTSMEISMGINLSKSSATDFHASFYGSKFASMEVDLFPLKFHRR